MFSKEKIEQPAETSVKKPSRPEWKNCIYCSKRDYEPRMSSHKCKDSGVYLLFTWDGWDRCDGFVPLHGCVTCDKRNYCKIDNMNKVYADKKITNIRYKSCPEWVMNKDIKATLHAEDDCEDSISFTENVKE